MRHLKADEVDYSTRPLTIIEKDLDDATRMLPSDHPHYFRIWTVFLWNRQDRVLPQNLFEDILLPDFEDHREACLEALHKNDQVNEVLKTLDTNWRFDYRDRFVDAETIRLAIERFHS